MREAAIGIIPIAVRPRFVLARVVNTTTLVTVDFPMTQVLPTDWSRRFWCLATIRGYRSGTTTPGNAVYIDQLRAEQVLVNKGTDASAAGFGFVGQDGPIPCFWPMPPQWSGTLTADVTSDNGAALNFRLHFELIELTRAEWLAMRGLCGDDDAGADE